MENELYHHGVKGMRWGIRRYQNKDGTLTAYGKKRYAKELGKLQAEKKRVKQYEQTAKKMQKLDDMRKDIDGRKHALSDDTTSSHQSKTEAKPKQKTIHDMSNEEIQAKIDRINLERRYADLTRTSSNKEVSKGKQFAMKVLEDSGKNIATQTVTYLMGTAVNKAIEAAMGESNAINPKKGQKDK